MNETIRLSDLANSPDLTKFSKNARVVAGTFFAHMPKHASVRFTMKTQVPTEFTRLGLVELVKHNVLKCTVHADETRVYRIVEDCTGFLRFKTNAAELLEPINRKGRPSL